MAAIDVDDGDGGIDAARRRFHGTYERVYAPLLIGAGLAQLLAVVWQHVTLAVVALAVGAVADLLTADERNVLRGRLRRVGLGLLQRIVYRAALLLAVLGPAGVPRAVLFAYVAGLLVLGLASRLIGYALQQVLRESPALPARNLPSDLPFADVFLHLQLRRLLLLAWVGALEVPLAVALALGHLDSASGRLAGLVLAIVTSVAMLVLAATVALRARRLLHSDAIRRYESALGAAIVDSGARVVAYFTGEQEATYQLNQWVPVFERLDRPVLYLLREAHHLEALLPTRNPVIVARRHRDVEVALASDPMVVLYVSTAGRNIHFLRYGRPKHVFLNHGDSDKVSSANPVVKVYDRLFVAGQIGIDRYREAGIDLADDRFVVVGRPQLDRVLDERRRVGDGPATLLYAPTWEGFFDAADYSSLERSGEAIVRHVLTHHPDVRIVFKPHPASGTVRPAAAAARRRVTALLRDAGAPHVLAADQPDLDLLAWFDRSDVLLSDISAVVTDYLATDKPYLVTNPRGLDRDEFRARFPSHHAAYVVAADLADLEAQLTAALGDDPLAVDRAEMKRRVLGDLPDGSFVAFSQAVDQAFADAQRDAARVVNTFAFDR